MIRFFLFPLLIVAVIFAIAFSIYITYKTSRWLGNGWRGIKKYTTNMYDDQLKARSQSDLPDYIQQGLERLRNIKISLNTLPEHWSLLLQPVISRAEAVTEIVLEHPVRGDSVRSFFTVTLDALEHFVGTLKSDHGVMGKDEEEKALQSIEVFKQDFIKYEDKLNSKRRFDFQVMTEVIKQRLRK